MPIREGLWSLLLGFTLMASLLTGCSPDAPTDAGGDTAVAGSEDTEQVEDYVEINEETTPEERKFLEAGRPFIEAVANEQFDVAYGLLSSHAKARMSLNQFNPPDDKKQYAKNAMEPLKDVSAERFVELMAGVVGEHGHPSRPIVLYIMETDPKILSGKIDRREDRLSVMFAIGAMPETIPADIRRASLRGQVETKWTADQVEAIAKEHGMTQEEVIENHEGRYFNLKYVLVEEQDELKVGYFEFLPPSILD